MNATRRTTVDQRERSAPAFAACASSGRARRYERDVADIKAALVTKSMPQQSTVPPMAKQTAWATRR
jgi:hypothetical protein